VDGRAAVRAQLPRRRDDSSEVLAACRSSLAVAASAAGAAEAFRLSKRSIDVVKLVSEQSISYSSCPAIQS